MVNMTNDPVSTMWSAAGSVVVRVGSFFVAAWLSMVVAACVVNGEWPSAVTLHLLPFFWLLCILVGLLQLWGFLAYGALAALFVAQVHLEKPLWFTLPAVVVIQALETTRCWIHGQESTPPTRALVLLAILGALLSAMAILYVRRTSWLGRPHA